MIGEIGKIDLHMHSTVSDGTDSPAELLSRIREAGIGLFSLTDHDAVKGCTLIRAARKETDPLFITGAEFSCRDEQGKYHILGYGYDPDSEAIRELTDYGHGLRMKKVRARLAYLKDSFGFVFPEEEIRKLLAMDNPGKPHIGNLMVRYGYARSKDEAIRDVLNRFRIRNEYIRPENAIRSILAGGGVPVLAHPSYGSGDELIMGEEMEERLLRLKDYGLLGVEAFYSGFTERLRSEILSLAERYDLYVTAGSDYHGSNKMVELGDTGMNGPDDAPQGMLRFLDRVL